DERAVEQVTLGKVANEGSEGAIGRRQQLGASPVKVIAMAVVTLSAGAVIVTHPVYMDKTYAGFDEAAREQRGLPEDVTTIALAHPGRFGTDVERTLCGLRGHEIEGTRVIGI